MGADYVMPQSFKKIALKSLMVGRAREFFETMEETGIVAFDKLLGKSKEYAAKRRLEANVKKNGSAMDVDGVDGESGEWQWEDDGSWWTEGDQQWDELGAVGKGKAMGKGYKGFKGKGKGKGPWNGGMKGKGKGMGKGKGKGKGKGGCWTCGSNEHRQAECPQYFHGQCAICGEWGHKAEICKRRQGVNEVER